MGAVVGYSEQKTAIVVGADEDVSGFLKARAFEGRMASDASRCECLSLASCACQLGMERFCLQVRAYSCLLAEDATR